MSDRTTEVFFPDGEPTAFQRLAVQRLSDVLCEHGVAFERFRLNVGAKRGFWTAFTVHGREHVLAIYPDELNILAASDLYENYLHHEFRSPDTMLESFSQRLARLLREGVWRLPEEDGMELP